MRWVVVLPGPLIEIFLRTEVQTHGDVRFKVCNIKEGIPTTCDVSDVKEGTLFSDSLPALDTLEHVSYGYLRTIDSPFWDLRLGTLLEPALRSLGSWENAKPVNLRVEGSRVPLDELCIVDIGEF